MKAFCQLLMVLLTCAACQTDPSGTSEEDPFYAPDFTLTALDGTSYTLSALQGHWVIVTFWATTCPPCLKDMPRLQGMADDSKGRVIVLGVNMREPEAIITPFLATIDVHFPILLNPYDQMLLDYNVIGLPQTFLITPAGEIVDRRFGPVDIEAWDSIMQKQR